MSKKLEVTKRVTTLLFVSVIAACSSLTTQDEPVELTFTFPVSSERSLFEAAAEAFEQENPNVTINMRPDPTGTWSRDESHAVDVFTFWLDPSLMEGETPFARNLDPWLATTDGLAPADFYPQVLAWVEKDGMVWALPAGVDLELVYYNKDIFDERGVDYPQPGWSWAEFLWTAEQLTTAAGGETQGFDGRYSLAPGNVLTAVSFVHQHGGSFFDVDPLTAEALQWYADLALVHGVAPLPNGRDDGRGLFADQDVAMWIGTLDNTFGGSSAAWDFEWGAVSLPRDEREGGQMFVRQYYYITSHSLHPDEAWDWIQYLVSRPLGESLPAVRSVAESASYRDLVGEELAAVKLYAVERATPAIRVSDVSSVEFVQTYSELVESVLRGEVTAAEALATLSLQPEE